MSAVVRPPVVVTEADITKSYVVLELLTVCAHAARNVTEIDNVESMGSSIAYCLEHAQSLASDIHTILEQASVCPEGKGEAKPARMTGGDRHG